MDIGHRHLVLAYAATIVIQLVYLGYVAVRAKVTRKAG
jgi:hypothetical protein